MPRINLDGYAGINLPSSVLSLLEILERYGFEAAASTKHAGKTLNLYYQGERCGYVNSTVLAGGSVLGYHFRWSGKPNNACPPELAERLLDVFSQRYECDPLELEIHHGTGSNAGRTNLHIRNPTLALRVLLKDVGLTFDEDVLITRGNERFTEGAVRDVIMQDYERSKGARLACLAHYGFNCFVCGENLRKKYRGLNMELIHVHHEIPMATISSSHTVDPILDLKPVCPNCHAVIHARVPPFTVAEAKQMLIVEE